MMSSLFEVYDPYTFFMNLSLNWSVTGFLLVYFFINYWLAVSSLFQCFTMFFFYVKGEFSSFHSSKVLEKGGILLFVCLFFYVLVINLLGLVPYLFSVSSHLVFALSFGLPLWAGIMLLGWLKFTNLMFIHLIPSGTPFVLIPLMVLIETTSSLIRPWSLGVRLMANMISGHLLMSLLGDCGMGLFFLQPILLLFEFFVCFIQAYVFSALLTLYSSEL